MDRQLIEIGIVVAGGLGERQRDIATSAVEASRDWLSNHFPEFEFRFRFVPRMELEAQGRVEPAELLQRAVEDRDTRHWDFAFVLTANELAGSYGTTCLAALSRPLDAAAFTLVLDNPLAESDVERGAESRDDRMGIRLASLMAHAVGHLSGLGPSREEDNLMYRPVSLETLDRIGTIDESQRQRAWKSLSEVADLRLEEGRGNRLSGLAFLTRALWINRREVADAVLAARPWQLPRRLSRLAIASVSTLVVLLMTAEAWDLGLSQSPLQVGGLAAISLVITTIHVVVRQQLLLHRRRRWSEQTVTTAASAILIVAAGMLCTWGLLLAISFLAATLLFPKGLIATWAASISLSAGEIGWGTGAQMSGFCASIGLLIGSLGASFESQSYFRHTIFVDEEL